MNFILSKKSKRILFLFFVVFFTNNFLAVQSRLAEEIQKVLHDSNYIICIDGGGSKTELQILDRYGNSVALRHNGTVAYVMRAGGSNIKIVGEEGVKNTIDTLLNDLKIEETAVDVKSIVSQCIVIAGFAGAAGIESKNILKNLFKEYNFDENKIIIAHDAAMALETITDSDGIILISGTGSICFGKKGAEIIQVGGLGRWLGDEGSGYYIGIHALKAALEEEYGWGNPTSLKIALRKYFKTSDLKSIITPFYRGEITNYQIAALAPIVFDQAEMNDSIMQT
jgi:N-acetylglucosamine kinase-like BadF-type ATPase